MGGSTKSRRLIHQYVLEALTGLPEAQTESRRLGRFGFIASLIAISSILALAAISDGSVGGALPLAFGLVLASIPFGVWAHKYAAGISLNKENLRLKQLLIGKRGYRITEDRAFILRDDKRVESGFYNELELFSAAASLLADEPVLRPSKGIPAWQTIRTFDELPGVGVGFSSFGPGGRTYAFLYGQPKTILENTEDIWDLGYIRKLSAGDLELFKNTAKNWKRQNNTVAAIAYAQLPAGADPQTAGVSAITRSLTLLGLTGLHGTREYGKSFPINPAHNLRTAARSSLDVTLAILFLGVLSYLGMSIFSTPMIIGIAQIFLIKIAVEIPLVTSLAWDHAGQSKRLAQSKKAIAHTIHDSISAGLLMSGLAISSLILHFVRHDFPLNNQEMTLVAHSGGLAISLLTISLCVLADVLMKRSGGGLPNRFQFYNPLFMLGLASAVLGLCIGIYATGPLLANDIWFAFGIAFIFIAFRLLQAYANAHHTRDHILQLLGSAEHKV